MHKRTGKKLTRKRQRDPSAWKSAVRKRKRQGGEEYTDSRGKVQPARTLKKDCEGCKFLCPKNIVEEERKRIFNEFWAQNDQDKRNFYCLTTVMKVCKRKRTKAPVSKKGNSFSYYLPLNNGDLIRVCKVFYLNTLDISQTRVNTFHKSKNPDTATPSKFKWAKNKNGCLPDDVKERIREHIASIPKVESHYCRKDTNKEYVSQWGLSLNALYRKYQEKCEEEGRTAAKISLYRQIFNNEFNIAFHFPKSDRCDRCEEFKNIKEPTEEETQKHTTHRASRRETEDERNADRNNKNAFVVCFDMENVFALPRANISSFFYKRKLNVYHMTAHCSVDKSSYGGLWHEAHNGRCGNDIASVIVRILEEIVSDHKGDKRMENIILWSDSCVPQNRNQMFATAVKYFLSKHPDVKSVQQKFCEPGHSSIQEVDNLHSRIERACLGNEIYSPLGLVRILTRVNHHKVIQMRPENFRDFGLISSTGVYSLCPFSQVKSIFYQQDHPRILKFKLLFSNNNWNTVTIFNQQSTRKNKKFNTNPLDFANTLFKSLKPAKPANPLSKEKKGHRNHDKVHV